MYISAEPAGSPSAHIIPQGILESSIKITNEPPTGMLANLHKALDNFNQVMISLIKSFSNKVVPLFTCTIFIEKCFICMYKYLYNVYSIYMCICENVDVTCLLTKLLFSKMMKMKFIDNLLNYETLK